jgi:single-strand DNA-binding protein
MSKGSLIGLTGRIQTRSYENKQGQTVYVTEVMTNDIVFLEPKKQNQSNYQNQQPQYQQNNYAQNEPQYEPQSKVLDIDTDDLPF